DGAALLATLQQLGLINGASFQSVASGYIPVSELAALSATGNLGFAHESGMTTNAGSVSDQGDIAQHSNIARANFGVNGKGVPVGILSDSYAFLRGGAAGVASGDLPAGGVFVIQDSGNTDEGRAMAEIVHDVAPGSPLWFATANGGQANFANNII